MQNPITLALVGDKISFRKGMRVHVQQLETILLVWEGDSVQDFFTKFETSISLPDIILIDLKVQPLEGLEQVGWIARKFPAIRIVLYGFYFSRNSILHFLRLGVAAWLPKQSKVEEVERTMCRVDQKGFYFNEGVMQIIRENLTQQKKPSMPMLGLEVFGIAKEILQLICEQYTPAEIACKLNLNMKTVIKYRESLRKKFNCRNTAGLVALAIQQNLVEVDSSIFWKKNQGKSTAEIGQSAAIS